MPYKDPSRQKVAAREHYLKNKPKYYLKKKVREKKISAFIQKYKNGKKCLRCPESFTACLEFHHRDPADKDMEVSMIARHGWSEKRILEEIKKCDLLCANCHRKEHFNGL